jgi:hypothetical protein
MTVTQLCVVVSRCVHFTEFCTQIYSSNTIIKKYHIHSVYIHVSTPSKKCSIVYACSKSLKHQYFLVGNEHFMFSLMILKRLILHFPSLTEICVCSQSKMLVKEIKVTLLEEYVTT